MIVLDVGNHHHQCDDCRFVFAVPVNTFRCRVFNTELRKKSKGSRIYPLRCDGCREAGIRFDVYYDNLLEHGVREDILREALAVATTELEGRIEEHTDTCVIDTPKWWKLGNAGTCSGKALIAKLREVEKS